MVTISLCMIVKNEEKHLARCLGCVAKLEIGRASCRERV